MKKYIIISFGLVICQSCSLGSCEEGAEMYRKIEFEMKIERISSGGTRHIKIEGKDKLNANQEWKDFGNWLLSINKIKVGDSIVKPKGKAFLLLKKMGDSTYTKYHYECDNKKYDR